MSAPTRTPPVRTRLYHSDPLGWVSSTFPSPAEPDTPAVAIPTDLAHWPDEVVERVVEAMARMVGSDEYDDAINESNDTVWELMLREQRLLLTAALAAIAREAE